MIFDGTAGLCKALAIVIYYVQENFKPTQCLICLEVLAKPLKSSELAQRLMSCLAVNHNFGPNMVLATTRDGAAVNGAAIRQLSFFYPNIFDVTFFLIPLIMWEPISNLEFWIYFFRHWISLFANSYNAKLLWKERTGQSMHSYSNTRWWSKWEVQKQVYEYFCDVVSFLQENEENSATRQHLLEIIDNPRDLQDLRLELAVIVDAGAQFVKATYYLEGDGPFIFSCYKRLSAVTNAIGVANFPSTSAIAREIANGDAVV